LFKKNTCYHLCTPVRKTGCIMGTPRLGRRPQGFRYLSQRPRPSSITSQIPAGTPELWPFNCTKIWFALSKSKSFCLVFIKLGEYVGGHNISTKFYNQPHPPCTSELWPFNCPNLGFLLSKSKSFRQVFIKLGEYVVRHNISTKVYNLPNSPRHSWIMTLELSKKWISGTCSPSRISCFQKCCHYHWINHKYDGRILCQFDTLVYYYVNYAL